GLAIIVPSGGALDLRAAASRDVGRTTDRRAVRIPHTSDRGPSCHRRSTRWRSAAGRRQRESDTGGPHAARSAPSCWDVSSRGSYRRAAGPARGRILPVIRPWLQHLPVPQNRDRSTILRTDPYTRRPIPHEDYNSKGIWRQCPMFDTPASGIMAPAPEEVIW